MHRSSLVTIAVLLTASVFPLVKCDDQKNSSQADYVYVSTNYNDTGTNVVEDDDDGITRVTNPLPEEETNDSVYVTGKYDWLTREQENKMLFYSPNKSLGHDCCPSTYELTTPVFARNLKGDLVTLYSNDNLRQQFIEVSCKEGIVNQRCRFIHKMYFNRSKCVQKYSFSYALIATNNATIKAENSTREYSEHARPTSLTNFSTESDVYSLDQIIIRSGCSCVIESMPPPSEPTPELELPQADVGVKKVKKIRKITKIKKKVTKAPES